jgi:hypothetical protein
MASVLVGLDGKCIDINSGTTNNGAPIVLWEQYWGTSQMWNLTGDGYIESLLDDTKCLDIKDVRHDNGAPIQLWEKLGGVNQKWIHDGDNCLVNASYPNMCIDVAQANTASGTGLILWEKNGTGSPNQKWYFAPYGDPSAKHLLNPYEVLHFNDSLQSEDGRCKLIMQSDGNLVLYFPNGETPWASGTENSDADYAVMQGDGNFVIYNAQGQWKWDSATDGHPGSYLRLHKEGFLTIYDIQGIPIWSTTTIQKSQLQPLGIINLSYKIFTVPGNGMLPRPNMEANIHSAVQQINYHCLASNFNFRFRLIEEPVLIGGPEASGHVNFWFNTRFMDNTIQIHELDAMSYSFFDNNHKFDITNCFAWRDNAINIYLTGTGYGGQSLFPGSGNIIGLAIDADIIGMSLQIHEMGHFFGLPHTHENNTVIRDAVTNNVLATDTLIKDILIDHAEFHTNEDIAQLNYSKSINELNNEEKQLVENTWSNIMSYHDEAPHRRTILTPGQLKIWDTEMRSRRSNVLK